MGVQTVFPFGNRQAPRGSKRQSHFIFVLAKVGHIRQDVNCFVYGCRCVLLREQPDVFPEVVGGQACYFAIPENGTNIFIVIPNINLISGAARAFCACDCHAA